MNEVSSFNVQQAQEVSLTEIVKINICSITFCNFAKRWNQKSF